MKYLTASCLLSVLGDILTEEINATSSNSTVLVDTIRRQLMKDNYDYLPSESEETFPIVRRARDDQPAGQPAHYYDYINKINEDNNQEQPTREQATPTARAGDAYDYSNQSQREEVVSKNDLLYYVDDEKLRKDNEADGSNPSDISFYSDIYDNISATHESSNPTVKYKMLKVNDPHPSRRSLSFRRFIKEESPDGVALTNLDALPFPQFRLPPERRQYMHEQHDAPDKDNDDTGHGESTLTPGDVEKTTKV